MDQLLYFLRLVELKPVEDIICKSPVQPVNSNHLRRHKQEYVLAKAEIPFEKEHILPWFVAQSHDIGVVMQSAKKQEVIAFNIPGQCMFDMASVVRAKYNENDDIIYKFDKI